MSLQALNDEEFSAKLHEARSFVDGLKAEADARQSLLLGATIAAAQEHLAHAVQIWRIANKQEWEFVKPDGSLGVCSWCQKEMNVQPKPEESHGICQKHLEAMRAEVKAVNQRREAA